MDNQIRNLLTEEIKNEIEGLNDFEQGSEEHSAAVKNLAALYKLKIDEVEAEREYAERREKRLMDEENHKRDNEIEKARLAEQTKDRYFKLGMEAAELILPLIFYATWMRRGFKFEEKGTFTSTTFRGLFNRFRPTKK